MKVLFLILDLSVGGAERQLVALAGGLAGRGHQVGVSLFRRQGALLGSLDGAVAVHDLEKGGQGDVVGFLLRLRRLVEKERPDVIYSFLGVPNLSAILLKALGVGVPVVWGVRASDMDLAHYGWLARFCYGMERRLARFADRIIVNSEAGHAHAVEQGFPVEFTSVVHNGIDTARFVPVTTEREELRGEWGVGEKETLVGLIARLDPMKGHQVFIEAARIASARNGDFRFVCVGEGGLRSRLEAAAHAAGVAVRIIWAGERKDMLAVYGALDLCCLASLFGEGFPNVLGEAMACGVPCVATDVGDAALIMGDTGIVVPSGDAEVLGAALVEMADVIKRGDVHDTRQRVVANFSVDVMVRKTEEILAAVVAGRD